MALIGAGIFARETYVPNIDAQGGARIQLTAILSRSAGPIEETLSALKHSSGDQVLRFIGSEGEEHFFAQARDICDAVIIVVPIPLLGGYVERCLALGVHVLSEKPVAMTSTEARRLITLYRGERQCASCLWHVAENYRLEPAVSYARGLVQRHAPLRPKTFSLIALRQQSPTSKFAVTTWRAQPAYSGSFVLDGGIHFVALLRTILGADITDMQATYEERSVCEVGTCGACRVGDAMGTFLIRYGLFSSVVCRLDVYFDDAILSIIQHKGEGWEVAMTGTETRRFPFGGLEAEFEVWLRACEAGEEAGELSPEEALTDLIVVENMCRA